MSGLMEMTPFEQRLWDENQKLREEARVALIRPIPDRGDPGWELWSALMEDRRDDGEIRLRVRHASAWSIDYEPVADGGSEGAETG